MSENVDDDDECTIDEEEQERLMLVELPPKKSEQGKISIIDGLDDTGGQTSGFLHLRSAFCLLWTIVQFLVALVGVYHLSSQFFNRYGGRHI